MDSNILFYEDITENDEIWLLQCPKMVTAKALNEKCGELGSLVRDGSIVKLQPDGLAKKYQLSVFETRGNCQVNCLLSTRSSNENNIRSINLSGRIILQEYRKIDPQYIIDEAEELPIPNEMEGQLVDPKNVIEDEARGKIKKEKKRKSNDHAKFVEEEYSRDLETSTDTGMGRDRGKDQLSKRKRRKLVQINADTIEEFNENENSIFESESTNMEKKRKKRKRENLAEFDNSHFNSEGCHADVEKVVELPPKKKRKKKYNGSDF